MALRKMMDSIRKPVDVLDREQLAAFCEGLDVTPLDELPLRVPSKVAGEISAIRLVPRAGAPALEVTISDGHGRAVAVFLGRRTIPGMTPGRRLVLEGAAVPHGPLRAIYNPSYRFLSR